MVARSRLGLKDGNNGIWISPPGVDCLTAPPSALNLEITRKMSQLIGYGRFTGVGTVALGLSRVPAVFLSSRIDYTLGGVPIDVIARPSNFDVPEKNVVVQINGGGVSMSIYSGAANTAYAIYRQGLS